MWFTRSSTNAQKLVENEAKIGLLEPGESITENLGESNPWLTRTALIITLIVSNIAWAAFGLLLRRGFRGRGYEADFLSPRPLPYDIKTIVFDDLLKYNTTSHEVYREMDPSLPLYFGTPSPAIDEAWAHLLQYEYPAVSTVEIAQNARLSFSKIDRHPGTGQYHMALDVFHNLHCLNAVRKELDKEYYGAHHHGHIDRRASVKNGNGQQSAVEAAQRDHIDHCLNHIRQSLQCRPDLSPAAMHIFRDTDGSQFFLGNAARHSCYNWQGIMDWAELRRSELGYASPI